MAISDQEPVASTPAFELADIYYTLFRHKWRIILCSLVGFVLAFAAYKLRPPPYRSEAKLFIRYVVTEGDNPRPGRDDTVRKSPDQRGETIIKSELEILNSLDLATEVANAVGPDKILPKPGSPSDSIRAALQVQKGLMVDVPANSSVIRIMFEHRDAAVAQNVLREIVDRYLKKHVEIHRAVGLVGDFLNQETDQLRARLAQTEEELRKATNQAGVISLEDAKKTFSEQIARLKQQIFDTQAELAERTSIMQEMTRGTAVPSKTDATAPAAAATADQIANYQKLANRVLTLRRKEQDLLLYFTEESSRVKEVRAQIAETEEKQHKMEAEVPSLLTLVAVTAPTTGITTNAEVFNPTSAAAQIAALQAKLKILNGQLEEVRNDATRVDQLAISILELRRRKELEEANYRYYSESLEQSRINEALGPDRVSNISQIETPTPALRDWSKSIKLIGGLMFFGVGAGLAWAFAIELYLDRSIRRPTDVERILRLPLFLSIPKLTRAQLKEPARDNVPALLPGGSTPKTADNNAALVPVGDQQALNAYYETLRDRLINYFDTLNVRHKPKLVAVTGLGKDSGVTTIAAGLARSFSETGEGNVLLVDMTQGQGTAQQFRKGSSVVGLEQLLDTKSSAQVNENLYVVTESSSSDRLAKGMPQRFNQLIPKLKASDFDYIIFDMPPVSQISITPRLASFMDMMLMVVESEKTDREIAAQASALLGKSRTPVAAVLNKTKTYVPTRLHQDREFLMGG